jgi:hypothetical protein
MTCEGSDRRLLALIRVFIQSIPYIFRPSLWGCMHLTFHEGSFYYILKILFRFYYVRRCLNLRQGIRYLFLRNSEGSIVVQSEDVLLWSCKVFISILKCSFGQSLVFFQYSELNICLNHLLFIILGELCLMMHGSFAA